jgi:hypothetical protein
MDRMELVRAHFDAYSDLEWAKELEPKLRAEGVEGASLDGCRKVWKSYSEERDWGWWIDSTRKQSDAELKEGIQECRAEISVIVSQRQGKNAQGAFQGILNGTHDAGMEPQELSKIRDTGREM